MKARLYVKKTLLTCYEGEIEDTSRLKRGGNLIIRIDDLPASKLSSSDPVLVEAENVEILGRVDVVVPAQPGLDVIIRKVEIREIPIQSLSLDKNSGKTEAKVPKKVSAEARLAEIGNAIDSIDKPLEHRQAVKYPMGTASEERDPEKYLQEELAKLRQILADEDTAASRGLGNLVNALQGYVHHNQRLHASHTKGLRKDVNSLRHVELRVSNVEEEMKELIENYIPDLSEELSDEG